MSRLLEGAGMEIRSRSCSELSYIGAGLLGLEWTGVVPFTRLIAADMRFIDPVTVGWVFYLICILLIITGWTYRVILIDSLKERIVWRTQAFGLFGIVTESCSFRDIRFIDLHFAGMVQHRHQAKECELYELRLVRRDHETMMVYRGMRWETVANLGTQIARLTQSQVG